ncbi:MAG: AAA+ family ATPase [Pseudotabrizicola sp.]|uniref:AAA+ family ATPase n=1 Tax=Pseudotabrizicola sp. TaxID=2939647 RepID=UPI0027268EBA|nr:AAA+ family ATPase [Pseudotabrizicola sp.]MDO8882273.1 AAA+ family ATPase [Pseudotabrizicola sp.]MDP2080564.1 AAA+ family ATPase [Pseudotabrizicola sp.]MDZ7573292.1 AAA+ family ATPase [Pseudotabrizicola sp.]
MKKSPLSLCLALILTMAPPLAAQTLPAPQVEEEKGFDLMEEGAKLLFRGLMREMEPALNEMGKALSEMEPALQNLMALIDDIRNYDAPRVLDNGDILIPRRKDVPRPLPPTPSLPEGEIEL